MTLPRLRELVETYEYIKAVETFSLAAAVSVAFNNPKDVIKLKPGYGEIQVEDVHPMLRPKGALERGG